MEREKRISPSKEEAAAAEWLPLQQHPIFSSCSSSSSTPSSDSRLPFNLLAWDGASRLYLWDPNTCRLHRLSLRFPDLDPASIEASSVSKMLCPDIQIHFTIYNISVNRTGSSLLLSGPDGLCVMYLYGQTSIKDNAIICRTISVGSQVYFDSSNSMRTLQASWHPYSDTHLGILSSDSVFRLFDLSTDLERPEQEYYLQPVEPVRCCNAVSVCPVAFSFGGEHLWDRFSVFVVFSDGSIYVLCPIVPFGSFYSWTSIEEIYKDAHTFGQKSSNLQAVTSSSFAIAWLEATFPDFGNHETEGGNLLALKARPYVPFDASLALQGPLRKVCRHENIEDSEVWNAECEGRAVSFLYNSISQDSVLLTAWSSGQLQIDALADELQPVWNVGSSPRLRVDSGHIVGVAMICESITQEFVKPDQEMHISNMVDTMWLGRPPPLLRLAVVDLALPANAANGTLISIFADPLVPERIYCLHGSGIDLIVLHFLPFSNQTTGKDEPVKAPSVYPILTTCHSDTCSPSSLNGFVALADSFGHSWIVGVTSQECIVMDMKDWNMALPLHVDGDMKSMDYTDPSEIGTPDIISKELLIGPKVVLTPQASSALRSLAADSIEGRSTLHHYFKLFHENYVEYGHKVYIELKHHGAYLKRILTDQHERLHEANQKLLNVEEKQRSLDDRLHHAVQMYGFLEERLQRFRSLPGANQKPLSRAERGFKSQLEPLEDPSPLEAHVVELPQLHVSCLAEPVEGVVALGTAIDVSPQLSIPCSTGSEGGVPITEVPVEELLEPSAPLPTEDSKGEGTPDVFAEVPPSPTILVVSTEATEVGIALKVTEGPSTPTIGALEEDVDATAFAEEVLTAAPVVAMAPMYNARQLAMNFVQQIVTLISTKLAYPDNWSSLHVERDMLLSSAAWVEIDVGLVGNLLARFSDTMSRLEQTKAEAAIVQAAREQRDRLLVLEAEIPRLMRVCDATSNSANAAEEDVAVQQEMLCVARRKIANLRELLTAAEAEEQATEARLADAKNLVETTRAIAWGEKEQLVELQREMLDLQENLANLPDYSQDIAQGEAEAGRLRGELSEALRDLM